MIKKTFMRGVKTTIPLFLTVAIVIWCISVVESFVKPLLIEVVGPHHYFPGMGVLVGLVVIFAIGILMNMWIAQWFYELGERVLKKIPLIKTFYGAFADLFAFFDSQKKEGAKNSPVLVDTPLGSLIAFITVEEGKLLPAELSDETLVAVYIPMSYQIGGYTTFIAKKHLRPLSMPIDQAMSYVLTAGVAGSSNR